MDSYGLNSHTMAQYRVLRKLTSLAEYIKEFIIGERLFFANTFRYLAHIQSTADVTRLYD
jgi:hypothetical protein